MLLELLAAAFLVGGDADSSSSSFGSPRRTNSWDSFEEDGSVFDHHGHEHIVDEDMYCEDCDDYHDDWE